MERVTFQVFTSAGPVLSSGTPVAIHGVSISSTGDVIIRDGTSGSGTIVIDFNGDVGSIKTHAWGIPIVFPNGAYVSAVGDGSRCAVFFSKI